MNSLQFFLWLQFVCLEMCTYASLKDMDAEKTPQSNSLEKPELHKRKKPEPNAAWSCGANLRL